MNQGILKSIVRGLESLTTDTGKAAIGQIGSRHAYATSVEHASKAVKDIADTHTIHSFRNSLELLKSVPNLRSYPGEVAVVPSKLSSALSAVHERLINTEQLAGLGPVQLRLLEGVQREFEFAIAAKRLERAGSQIFEQKFGANSLASHRPTSKIAEETVVRTDGSKIMAKTDGAFTQFAETAPRGELRLYSLSSGFHSGFIGDRLAFRRLGIGNGASSGDMVLNSERGSLKLKENGSFSFVDREQNEFLVEVHADKLRYHERGNDTKLDFELPLERVKLKDLPDGERFKLSERSRSANRWPDEIFRDALRESLLPNHTANQLFDQIRR